MPSDVIPVEVDTDVFLALPVCFKIVVRLDCVDEVLYVFLADILPKLSTTSVNWTGRRLCFQSPGTIVLW